MRAFFKGVLKKYIGDPFPDFLFEHPWDYILHFGVSFGGVYLVFYALKLLKVPSKTALVVSAVSMLALGLFKEYIDLYGENVEIMGDIIADMAGICLAAALLIIFKK